LYAGKTASNQSPEKRKKKKEIAIKALLLILQQNNSGGGVDVPTKAETKPTPMRLGMIYQPDSSHLTY
jgi:hypothetical protein